MFFLTRARQFERVFHDAIDAAPREDRLLHADFVFRAAIEPAADRRIFAFVIFAHDPEIDVTGFASRQRRRNAGHQPHRAHVGVELEFAADGNEQTPERNVIGYAGKSDGAQVDGIVISNFGEAVFRHHFSVFREVVAAPGFFVELELDVEFARGRFEHAHAFGDDFLADAVTGDDGDFVGFHFFSMIDAGDVC